MEMIYHQIVFWRHCARRCQGGGSLHPLWRCTQGYRSYQPWIQHKQNMESTESLQQFVNTVY